MPDFVKSMDADGFARNLATKDLGSDLHIPKSLPSDQTGTPYTRDNPMPSSARNAVKDDTGALLYPDDCAVTAVTRDANGNLLKQTISDGTTSWVQTITRDANGNLSAVSKWERQ
ncbi:hypothetical protein J2X65_003478 [Ancylobacter sp. 3268]|uniref:hypothetical protein n=1 Tax=Ancylobacter sp. 3268 TaxID=2817752 RepID=UPI0028662866|nr:hypothetical protein [Ancylobacter sp. 3268]MDR6954110.1 hypothetical protein [Ancylobacter sp. 3268]